MDNVDEVKKRTDIVDLISQYLQLKKAGINHSALCPFHSEKTPSFMVSPERQSFKCFGCGTSGDVITFFMEMEGFSFPEALKILGERVGVQVQLRPKEELDREKTRRDVIFNINLLAAKFFKATLWSKEGKAALNYLAKRGLSRKTIEKLKIGYAPDGYSLEKYFAKYKFSSTDISYAGHPERFRYRIMFPIFSSLGQIVGFSGRILEEVLPKGVPDYPKYLNTPETPVFRKSQAVYGINFAKEAIRKNKRAIVVEGQMDVAMSHEAGVEEAVASSGTALTRDHLKVLSRLCPNIIFSFDEDEAGQKAAHAAVKLALEMGLDIKLTTIEGFKDVGELVLADKSKWPEVISRALPPVEYLIEKNKRKLAGKQMTAQDKKVLAKEALEYIARFQDEIERSHYISYLAKSVGVPTISVEKALSGVKLGKSQTENTVPAGDQENLLTIKFLSFLYFYPEVAKGIHLSSDLDLKDESLNKVYSELLKCYDAKSEVEKKLKRTKENLPHDILTSLEAEAILWDKNLQENRDEAIAEFIANKHRFSREKNETLKADFAQKIAEAESAGDMEKVKELMIKLQENLK
ncbi:MAG: DNA primase [Candidatus Subteraquimicrobiales bacterium]|nr:DNA primase [Candidatus Subteraquimicrobiales bacterium]